MRLLGHGVTPHTVSLPGKNSAREWRLPDVVRLQRDLKLE
jgi:hypothetical protein